MIDMKVTFLGTNGWYDTETGNTPCVLIETEETFIVCDAGFGFYKLKRHVLSEKPVRLFISHLHYDHIIGLHTLPIFKLPQGLDVYAHKTVIAGLRSFLKRPFTSPPVFLPTKLRFHAITGASSTPIKFEMARLRHSVPCYGYSFNVDGKRISYCTDTGVCGNLKKLAKRADLLIMECAMAPGDKPPNLFHVTPESAASVAREAGVKKLALFHFDPGKYPSMESRRRAEDAARAIFKDTVAANDDTVISIGLDPCQQ